MKFIGRSVTHQIVMVHLARLSSQIHKGWLQIQQSLSLELRSPFRNHILSQGASGFPLTFQSALVLNSIF